MATIRLIIADDHPILRKGIRTLLEDSRLVEVVEEASTGREALDLVDKHCPDVLLLDVDMDDMSGLDVAEELYKKGSPVRVLILSAYDDIEHIQRLMKCGVAGYLLKDEASKVIVQAVEEIAHGQVGWFSHQINQQWQRSMSDEPDRRLLTERELQVLRLASQGKTNNGIAYALGISEKTVEKHLDSIYRKLDVRSRTEAAVVAIQGELI
ncbi:MAG: response regulator transcription factor [Caldilineaceae bacterium]|nr:response regulator transcription factor [Caldilineaceae bacterium]